ALIFLEEISPFQLCSDDGGNVTIGCFVNDFFPEPVTISWVSDVQGDQMTFPAVQNSDSFYSVSSQLTVPASSYDGQNFQCKVTHAPTSTSLSEDITALGCRIWRPPTPLPRSTPLPTPPHPGPEPELDVAILPPSLEDLYIGQNASITCVATNAPQDLRFSWSRSVGTGLEASSGEPEKQENGLYRLTSVLKVCAEEWNSGETFTCTTPLTFSCAHPADVSVQAPSVYVFPPPSEELARQETATLTCLASGFRPRDILVTWTQQDSPVASGSFSTFGPQEGDDGLFSVYSKLSVAAADWQRGDSFACVVGHDGIPMNFVQKSLDKSTGKPTHVNVSVILSDADSTCY
uniref:Ig-like domain-containing protein n=1 Tax=Cairina moschata TaxID=8855 RepID=A0A8C3BT83_CAIMO